MYTTKAYCSDAVLIWLNITKLMGGLSVNEYNANYYSIPDNNNDHISIHGICRMVLT